MVNFDTKYLLFGAAVLASYWYVLDRGIVFDSPREAPSLASSRGPSGRTFPTFWSTGYQGGK